MKPLAGTTRNGEPETRNARDVWLGWRLAWEGGPSLLEGGRWLVETAPGAGPDRPDGTPERTVTAVTLAAVDSAGRATGEQRRVTATVFVDATYEGDVALGASATYRIGREGREEFGEPHAGVLYQDFRTKLCYPGSTGAADRRVQAYNYRLCLTRDPSNRRPIPRPARYDRARYASQVADVQRGQIKAFMGWGSVGVLNQATLPNGKTDCNNHHYAFLSTDWPEASFAYAEAGPERRLAIAQAHREYLEGLVWFCQHDPALPEWFRTEARERGYAADEFQDNGGFPRQMYVREAARIAGDYVFSARDASRAPDGGRAPVHWDSIASGGYGIDSHATRQREDLALPPETDAHDGRRIALEGFMSISSAPYQLPYRIMLPQGIDGLLVPVAVSATHLGFGTIRMEPTWMALGEAAGTAAALAVARGVRLRDVPRAELQRRLVDRGAVIIYFEDLAPAGFTGHEALPPDLSPAVQFWGTHGFFATYQAEAAAPLTRGGGRPVALAGPARLRSLAPAAGGPGGLRRRRADHARRLPRAGTPVATRTVAAAPGAGGRDPPGGAGPAGSAQPGRRLPHALPDLRTPPVEHAELRRTRRSYLPSRARSTTTSHLSC